MRCPQCERPVLALFYSVVCESCTEAPNGRFHVGYVVWEDEPPPAGQLAYVWRSRHDALSFRTLRGDESRPIYCVLSEQPFTWRTAAGTPSGLTLAAELCEIYADHCFPPAANRAFLAPASIDPRAERVILPRRGRAQESLQEEPHSV